MRLRITPLRILGVGDAGMARLKPCPSERGQVWCAAEAVPFRARPSLVRG
jgi:hypothetical protein